MRAYLQKYRPFIQFLAKFFLTYLVLGISYQLYLSGFDAESNQIDHITRSVAYQCEAVLRFFGADAQVSPHPAKPYLKLFYSGDYVARIIEGCNAISVMILFVSFIAAFAGPLKATVVFGIAGCVAIHVMNVLRISFLAAAIHNYPRHEHFLHGVIFPMIIYGAVFLLWVIWVNKYSYHAGAKN